MLLVPTHRANTCCDRASCERLVGAHRESSWSSCHKIFLHAREAVVELLRESEFLSRDLCLVCERQLLTPTHAEKVLIVRDVSVHTQKEVYRESYLRKIRPNQAQYPSGAYRSSSSCEWSIEHTFARVCVYFYGDVTTINELLAR